MFKMYFQCYNYIILYEFATLQSIRITRKVN